MNLKAVLVLSGIVLIYIIIGGAIFCAIESTNESSTRSNLTADFQAFLGKYVACK